MSDLFEEPATPDTPGDNAPPLSVSELSGAVKRTIEGGFGRVRVRGEIGRVSRPRSGHVYLTLKDDRANLDGVIWKGQAGRLDTQPEEGLEVVVTGKLTTFPGQSKYQIVIESLAPAGVGALMAMLEKRRAALAAEGLFDTARKRSLPYLPGVIGVVTSPSGAVIRDILHRLRDRFPSRVLLWPVAVQGARAAPEVARAIAGFNALTPGGALPRPDLLIVARGGGSLEDLWAFNEDVVVRAAADSTIPLISAVGHETDTTLIDHAADRRAPTPTAAAEMAVPVRLDLLGWTEAQGGRLARGAEQAVGTRKQRLRDLARALPRAENLLSGPVQRVDFWAQRLPTALAAGVGRRRERLARVGGGLRPSTLKAQQGAARVRLARAAARLHPALQARVSAGRLALGRAGAGVSLTPIRRHLSRAPRDVHALARRLAGAERGLLTAWGDRLSGLERLRQTLGHKRTLARGFAIVRRDGTVVTGRAGIAGPGGLSLEFHDGTVEIGAAGAGMDAGRDAGGDAGGGARRRGTRPRAPSAQPGLFDD